MAGPLRWEDSGSQGAADFLPSTAVAHFAKNGSLPEGLTVSQLAQVCKEARAQGDMGCAEACSQAIVNLALEEAPSPKPPTPHLFKIMENQPECHATLMVMRYMYEGGLPEEVKEPLTLAKLPAEQLVRVLQTLPDSCALLPEHQQWQQHVNSLILSQYGDVHAVITSAQLRGYFQQLPFAAVKQWAGSDELTVDSENSVVELISLWMAGSQGLACSEEQEQQLSCLVRVQHLSPAPRKPLDPDELLRRSTIRWDVPRQQLVDLLASEDPTARVYSESVYLAGTGWRILMKFSKKDSQDAAAGTTLGVFSEPTALVSPEDLEPFLEGGCLQIGPVLNPSSLAARDCTTTQQLPRGPAPRPGSGSQGAADFLPSSAVAHFAKDGSLPEGLTVSQLAQVLRGAEQGIEVKFSLTDLRHPLQVCKEAKAQGDKGCAEACSQAIVNLALEEAGSPQPPTPRLEETFDSQAECDAARSVVRCMYEGKLPEDVKDPLTLARVCRVAERWAFSSLSSSCLKQLADLPPSQLPAEQLVLVLQTLPDSCALLPDHQQWQDRVHSLAGKLNALPLLLHLYGDVHAVITSAQLRTTFQQLPSAAVQHENSVVELISLWMAGPTGKGCSWVQKEQLSCLVRVQHLSPAPRKPLHFAELLRRSTIRWDVPRQQLVDLLASEDPTARVYSESFYIAGTGWRILMKLSKKKRKGAAAGFLLGVFSEPTALVSPEDLEPFLEGGCLQIGPVLNPSSLAARDCTTTQQLPRGPAPRPGGKTGSSGGAGAHH
ncbi:hypothetical protein V8C86DRAFT_3131552 [Haematococcus lacustris]